MYSVKASSDTPAALVFMVDQSQSMRSSFAGSTRAVAVADALNMLLANVVLKCTYGLQVRNRFHIGLVCYGGKKATLGLQGTEARPLRPIKDLADESRDETRRRKVNGAEVEQVEQVWIDPITEGHTPMCDAFGLAYHILEPWVKAHRGSYPPIVINITDGEATDSRPGDGPAERAEQVQTLRTDDGAVLVYNVHIGSGGTGKVFLPVEEGELTGDAAKLLFRCSSPLPPSAVNLARAKGISVRNGSRGFAYNAPHEQFLELLVIGTDVPE